MVGQKSRYQVYRKKYSAKMVTCCTEQELAFSVSSCSVLTKCSDCDVCFCIWNDNNCWYGWHYKVHSFLCCFMIWTATGWAVWDRFINGIKGLIANYLLVYWLSWLFQSFSILCLWIFIILLPTFYLLVVETTLSPPFPYVSRYLFWHCKNICNRVFIFFGLLFKLKAKMSYLI